MRLSLIFTGLGLLLVGAFFDNLRGPLLPVFSHQLSLSYEQVSWFLVLGYLAAAFCGAQLLSLIQRTSIQKIAALACLLAPVCALFSYWVRGLPSLLVFGVLVACTSALMGSMANLFVLHGTEPAYRARFYGLLHAMYGLGSQAAPVAVGFLLSRGYDWRLLFVGAMVPALSLGAWTFCLKTPAMSQSATAAEPERPFSWFSIQGLIVGAFCIYVAGEVLSSMWMVTYLVEVRGFSVEQATPYSAGFFIVITLSRLACYWVRTDRVEAWAIAGGLTAGALSFILGLSGYSFAFVFVGLIGPYFPLVLARLSRYLPREAPALTVRVMFMLQATLAFCHLATGYVCTNLGVQTAYWIPGVALCLAVGAIGIYFRAERRLVSL